MISLFHMVICSVALFVCCLNVQASIYSSNLVSALSAVRLETALADNRVLAICTFYLRLLFHYHDVSCCILVL
jgi:hypothetical protein